MKRREFLSTTLVLAAAGAMPRSARAADGSVEVLLDEPIGDIAPELHGQFTEHIGEVVYNGIWVGEDSKIPNIGGIRKALVERLRQLHVPVIRWPGGCFADTYNWRDGIGPRAQRPVRTNFWDNTPQLRKAPAGPQKYDPNTFGTAEFMRFCQLCGAQPYVAVNVRSQTPLDFDEWVEYCNSPEASTTLARTRAGDGSRDPYNVLYWGIGNESWGCGGHFQPEEYSEEFRRFTVYVPDYGLKLRFIACGPGADWRDPATTWTRGFLENIVAKSPRILDAIYGLSMHYYCGTTGKGDSLDFNTDEWYEMLWQADAMDTLIERHWLAMGDSDKQHKVKLVVDEWGGWHRTPVLGPEYLFSYIPSMRDALVTAITLDAFNRHAEKLAMCNDAQLVNNINTLFLAVEDRFVTTPIFHVFDMYKSHQGGKSVRIVCDAPANPVQFADAPAGATSQMTVGPRSIWGLGGSASLHGKTLILTIVNTNAGEPSGTEIVLRGGSAASVKVTVLGGPDIQAHNDFEHPNAVVPKSAPASISGSRFNWTFPPASVTKLEISLG